MNHPTASYPASDNTVTRAARRVIELPTEVIEYVVPGNREAVVAFADVVRRHGCSLAPDNIGNTPTSCRYLRSLPCAYIKIDGSFVPDLGEDPVQPAPLHSRNAIAHLLDERTITTHGD